MQYQQCFYTQLVGYTRTTTLVDILWLMPGIFGLLGFDLILPQLHGDLFSHHLVQ